MEQQMWSLDLLANTSSLLMPLIDQLGKLD